MEDNFDIIIIGGGIAGLYCCMEAAPDKKTGLFEATYRIGGRIETVQMEGFNSEYGAMRFDPTKQLLMKKLINDLELGTERFHEYSGPSLHDLPVTFDLDKNEKGLTILELISLAIQRVLNISKEHLLNIKEEEMEYIRREGIYKGQFLWSQGLWNVFSDEISVDAIKFLITNGSFYHLLHENPNAAEWIITMIKMFQMSENLKGVKNGMQKITDSMQEIVKEKNVKIYANYTLKAIKSSGKENIELFFENGKTFRARHVVLAIPPRSLKSINGLPEYIKKLLPSVMEIPLLKCFFIIKDPWWKENIPNEGLTTFPARELHYSKKEEKGSIMVYSDRPYINFWSNYVTNEYHDRTEIGLNKELPLMFARRMQIDPDRIKMYGIRDWGRDPYGAACHIWKPGIRSWEISPKLEAFSLNESENLNVHICGEAFSDFQGFMEGSLRSAHNVMTKMQG
jgi:monoamine oxidase